MHLIKIDPVGLQPTQARFDGLYDIAPRCAAHFAGVIHRQTELGRQHDIVAARSENLA